MQPSSATHYEKLQVHPAAPLDLITAAYWHLVSTIGSQTSNGSHAEAVHELSTAYAVLVDPISRAKYDRSIALLPQPLVPKLKRSGGLFTKLIPWPKRNGSYASYYELIRVDPSADPEIVAEGYAAMRTVYLRLVRLGEEPIRLLDILEEAYSVTSDAARRRRHDAGRNGSSKSRITKQANGAAATMPAKTLEPSRDKSLPTQSPSTKEAAREQHAQPKPLPQTRSAPAAPLRTPGVSAAAEATAHPRVRPLMRSTLRAVAGALGGVARAAVGTAKAAVLVVLFVPRCIFALGEFVVGLVTALIADPDRAPTGAVRRVWPDEEATLVARISESAVSAQAGDDGIPLQDGILAHVLVTGGPEEGARFEVSRWPISIGSAMECDIVLPDLAPQQLRLLARGETVVLYGLAESPSVLVNGEPVTWSALNDGDSVSMGAHSIRIER